MSSNQPRELGESDLGRLKRAGIIKWTVSFLPR